MCANLCDQTRLCDQTHLCDLAHQLKHTSTSKVQTTNYHQRQPTTQRTNQPVTYDRPTTTTCAQEAAAMAVATIHPHMHTRGSRHTGCSSHLIRLRSCCPGCSSHLICLRPCCPGCSSRLNHLRSCCPGCSSHLTHLCSSCTGCSSHLTHLCSCCPGYSSHLIHLGSCCSLFSSRPFPPPLPGYPQLRARLLVASLPPVCLLTLC